MRKQGFSLVEVIIAALILSLVVAGVLFVFSTEKSVVARTGRRFMAMEFARQNIEELRNKVGADTWPDGDLAAGPSAEEALMGGHFEDNFGVTRKYHITNRNFDNDGAIDYKQITLTVEWDEPTKQ